MTGGVAGRVTGGVTGGVSCRVTGEVTGRVTGRVAGRVTGGVAGGVTGRVTKGGIDLLSSAAGVADGDRRAGICLTSAGCDFGVGRWQSEEFFSAVLSTWVEIHREANFLEPVSSAAWHR